MKPILTQFLIFSFLAISFMTQNDAENDLVGKWMVKDVRFVPNGLSKEQMASLKIIKKVFLNARFEVKADQHFSLSSIDPDWAIKDAHWKYNLKTKSIVVQEWADRKLARPILMEIRVKKESNNVFFVLEETPILLRVEKGN